MSRFRLEKKQILKSGRQFSEVFGKGKRFSSDHFILIALASVDRKVGFAVSRQIRSAAKRNRAKRRMRELYRLHQHLLRDDIRFVLLARSGTERAPGQVLEKEILGLFSKVNLVLE